MILTFINRKLSKYHIILVFAFLIYSCKTSKNSSNTTTEDNKEVTKDDYAFYFENDKLLNAVLEKAKKQNKLVYVDIGAKWCVPCKLMKRDVYTHEPTARFFNKNFVNYIVDGEKDEGPDLRIIFEIDGYPTLLILDQKGKVIRKKTSSLYHQDLIYFAEEAIEAYNTNDY